MRHLSRSIGGAEDLRPASGAGAPADKWRILTALGDCAGDFALGHRELNVLRALLSFLPQRAIEPGAAVVFPSNEALSERLNGLPQSTLRRHLARLTASGLVRRHDSPNRKRYARRDRSGSLLQAFGFDLSPLAEATAAIEAAAARAAEAQQEITALREELAALRHDLLAVATDPEGFALAETARRLLRRKAAPGELRDLAAAIAERLSAVTPVENPVCAIQGSPETSASGARNERHQQSLKRESSDSQDLGKPVPRIPLGTVQVERSPEPDLAEVAAACAEARIFFPTATSSWEDVARTADKLAPMIGISPGLLARARAAMGWRQAATTMLCLLERFASIRNPVGYLTHLVQRAEEGRFSVAALLKVPRQGSPEIVS